MTIQLPPLDDLRRCGTTWASLFATLGSFYAPFVSVGNLKYVCILSVPNHDPYKVVAVLPLWEYNVGRVPIVKSWHMPVARVPWGYAALPFLKFSASKRYWDDTSRSASKPPQRPNYKRDIDHENRTVKGVHKTI